MGQWFQRLRANAKYGAVNDAAIQGYLRAASQIENIWQQIDDKVDDLILQSLPPWEAYTRMGYALAFVRACRMNVIFVQELLKAETITDTANAGYLPRVTYDQALALCEHIEPTIEEAIKAATSPRYVLPPSTLPLKLGPHVESSSQSLPLSHLQGTIRAAQEMKDWTAGLLAKYELALHAAKQALPQEVSVHLEQMKSELELGDFHLRTGVDMVGQISQGQVAEELHLKAEGFLWEAMEGFYRVSQLVAMPDLHPHPTHSVASQPSHVQARQVQVQPTPPEPVALDLLNQITAEPDNAQKTLVHTSPDLLKMLNQLTAGSQARQGDTPQPSPEMPGLLDQGVTASQAQPRAPDIAASDTGGLLSQGQETVRRPPVQHTKARERQPQKRTITPADNTLDLLAEICGEQEKPDG